MENFTPLTALAGGILIGLSASLLLWLNGRIAGVSTIVNGLLPRAKGDALWRLLFLTGIVLGAATWYSIAGGTPIPRESFPALLLLAGGALVGYGTSLGSGCTSGHGVCGLGRLSLRSLVATLVFLVTGIATTFVVRHGLGVY
jgi:uncharacterized membrane protein YedE/YeeE